MNEFSIYFDLGDSYEIDITNWIYTAMSKKSSKVSVEHTFRSFLAIHCSTRVLWSSQKSLLFIVKSLRSLWLDTVNVTGEVLEFFIYNCPYPEVQRLNSASWCNHIRSQLSTYISRISQFWFFIYNCPYLEEPSVAGSDNVYVNVYV